VVATSVTLQCYAVQFTLRAVERRLFRRRGIEPDEGRPLRYVIVSGLFFAPALLGLGFTVGDLACRVVGLTWTVPDPWTARMALVLSLSLALLFSVAQTAFKMRKEMRRVRREAEARIRQLELGALTAEMNPHLLFNSLNTIAALVRKNPSAAEDAVLNLSDMYRGMLRSRGRATHSLADELTLCETYLAVERMRFGDRLRAVIDIDPSLDPEAMEVPVMLLQPFVENAVRHGVSPRTDGGTVTLRVREGAQRLSIDIEDDGVGLGRSPHRGSGMSVANCRERLLLAFGDLASIDISPRTHAGTRVHIGLPFRPIATQAVA
jgi:LytS/YehU family sensor histidine kinase